MIEKNNMIHILEDLQGLYERSDGSGNINEETASVTQGNKIIRQAMSAVEKNNFNVALELFRKAATEDPNDYKAWLGLALLHKEFGDKEIALANTLVVFDLAFENRLVFKLLVELALDLNYPQVIIERIKRSEVLTKKYGCLIEILSQNNLSFEDCLRKI